jgi:membrane associated rhomboid family serine protease
LLSHSLAIIPEIIESGAEKTMRRGRSQAFFESPHAVTYILILLNAAVFGLTLIGSSPVRIDSATLFNDGALYQDTLARKEYWRFVAYAFLHANILHFGLNMVCIAAWSGLLEHRLGATYFLAVYLASAIGGGIASLYGHAGPFLTVGASGAISGIVGALLCLTILGKLALSPQFFIVTIGINGILAARVPNVDWLAHAGGFTAGFASCALLNTLETFNRYWLRCKFPEFVKFGIAAVSVFIVLVLYFYVPSSGRELAIYGAECGALILLLIKLADLALSRPKGLAVLALVIACFYASASFAIADALITRLPAYCEKVQSFAAASEAIREAKPYIAGACRYTSFLPALLALLTLIACLLLLWPEFRRGMNDVGFVANTLRAERNRRHGL